MNELLTFANGAEVMGHMLEDGALWLYLEEISFSGAYELLSDPANTATITGERRGSVSGYNHLFSLREESPGRISAGIRKEVG